MSEQDSNATIPSSASGTSDALVMSAGSYKTNQATAIVGSKIITATATLQLETHTASVVTSFLGLTDVAGADAVATEKDTATIPGSESTQPSLENQLNTERLNYYKKHFTPQFLKAIRESDFEYGYTSIADEFICRWLSQNALATKDWLNQLFIQYFPQTDITTGILRVIAHLAYDDISPQGPTMALAALAHESAEVKECGIRAFENWENLESLRALKKTSFSEEWLARYAQQVIADLEERLLHVSAR